MGTKIFFDDSSDEIEGRWLESVFKVSREEDRFIADVEFKGVFFSADTRVDSIDDLKQMFKCISC